MRAVSSEKDNISSAYLKTTLRLAQSKESEQEAQERMVQALADRDGLQQEVDRLQEDVAGVEGERDKLHRKLKQSNKARCGRHRPFLTCSRTAFACCPIPSSLAVRSTACTPSRSLLAGSRLRKTCGTPTAARSRSRRCWQRRSGR
eukprot:SAG22_NODE_1991_length_3196_cov_80.930578_2_plen_146_part_00